jgi:hypothetical protein
VYRNEIRFSGVMRDISAIVPEDVWLTSMAVAVNSPAGTSSTTGTTTAATTQAGGATPAVTPGSPGAGSPVATITCGRWPAGPRRADSRCT